MPTFYPAPYPTFHRWHKYQHLWAFDKNLSCEKYVHKYDQIYKYDEKFFFFEDIIADLDQHVKFVDIGMYVLYVTRP